MKSDVYSFKDYRSYLRQEFSGKGEGRGRRGQLAQKIGCQTSFLSQVLTDRAHLSLEHAIKTSAFLSHDRGEKTFFMLLVQFGKAGSKDLEDFFENEIVKIRKSRESIKERINVKTELSSEDQMKYYSSWYYSAVHILSALPEFNSIENMVRKLKLDIGTVKNAAEFLEARGFISKKGQRFSIGSTRIHLPNGAAMLPRHHSNWRIKAIEAADNVQDGDLHYSAILGISKRDQRKFKERLLQIIQEFEPVISSSKEEIPLVFLVDLFEL